MGGMAFDYLPIGLADLLSNTLVLRQTAPYLTVASVHALAATSRTMHRILSTSPDVLRYLDLSTVKSAMVRSEPLDSGGISWRAERMDESLTEDEFYSGPLRGIFYHLQRQQTLRHVTTLILDGLSVPADLVRDIICEDRFNVRLLSIREAKNLNERKLQQVLKYAVRPGRPTGTPKVKGIYFFGARDPPFMDEAPKKRSTSFSQAKGIMASQGAMIGAEWNQKSSSALAASLGSTDHKWYQCSGRMMARKPSREWADTLQVCAGIIAFDAVLCRGQRHDSTKALIVNDAEGRPHPGSYLPPTIASVALGPMGCETCHSSPEGPAIVGESPLSHLPLLGPIPRHSASVRVAQTPYTKDGSSPPPLFARCEECLKGRWCERCHKWWDEDCYALSTIAQRTELQQTEYAEHEHPHGAAPKQNIKIIGVRRDCFGCGHTCITCKELFIRKCQTCKSEYCLEDNDASSATKCDWCNYTSRRTVEMY